MNFSEPKCRIFNKTVAFYLTVILLFIVIFSMCDVTLCGGPPPPPRTFIKEDSFSESIAIRRCKHELPCGRYSRFLFRASKLNHYKSDLVISG